MPKLQTRKYLAPEPQILAFPDHYVNVPGKIEFADLAKLYATIQPAEKTKMQNIYTDATKVLPRGLAVHIDGDGKVTAPAAAASGTEAVKPNAVLFDTIEFKKYDEATDKQVNAAILVHGFVRADRLIGKEKANLDNGMIYVVNK
uniref:Uncharacterized protein n=1 Tax=Siphoviridae sp. ctG7D9 TaxID=2826218 RepID=A0A8S5MBQ6_9CAUD|nr:MAG TPA: hypothetical protein [Siphoviridae sp. ctG7D9]